MDTSQQVAVIPRDKETSVGPQRQRRSIAEKRRIVEETLVPGASVARVARGHGINANQVFGWRGLYRRGRLGEQKAGATSLLAVRIAKPAGTPEAEVRETRAMSLGRIEVESSKGRVRLEGSVDTAALRVVLERLLA
jgi:transposase